MIRYLSMAQKIVFSTNTPQEKCEDLLKVQGLVQTQYAKNESIELEEEWFRQVFFEFGLILKDFSVIKDELAVLNFLPYFIRFMQEFCEAPKSYGEHRLLSAYSLAHAEYLKMYASLQTIDKYHELFNGEYY